MERSRSAGLQPYPQGKCGLRIRVKPAFPARRSTRAPLTPHKLTIWAGLSGGLGMDPELSPDGLLKFSHKKTAKICDFLMCWRRERDSNPRCRFCPHAPLAGECLRPLGHLSDLTQATLSLNWGIFAIPGQKLYGERGQPVPCIFRQLPQKS